ncbi:MAG: M1 family metallopeptidase [candidate division Zixibacteria bacterium]|nr:M1 family metallopeptidase [candidate division Zixibacteria bacterium]
MAYNRILAGTLVLLILVICGRTVAAQDYWQQEVNYVMDITLEDDLRTINGSMRIEYINNSPDTLRELYLKAFPNAIRKDSYADKKRRTNNDYSLARLRTHEQGELTLTHRSGLDDGSVPYDLITFDNTIVTVSLHRSLLPGDTVVLPFAFTTVLPVPAAMRMGVDLGVIKAAYWYPQVCVYDRKLGWVNSQYLGWGECYGDYGTFDVTIDAPADQIVAATGVCVNEDEVLPESLRAQLDISNFLGPPETWPEIDHGGQLRKTWRFVAENVNDFAWTASNRFCLDRDTINGVEVVAYALREKAGRWTTAVDLGKQAIETFSEMYLPYQWPVIRITDSYSGMEFPMLVNCSGGAPSTVFNMLLYHEIGHQWFMGMIGFNQVDRAFLDEGFTTFAEHNIMEKYLGREGNYTNPRNWYEKTFGPELEDRNVRGFRPLMLLMKDDADKPMIVPYDRGEEYWPYRVSMYYKSAALLYSLRSILGDDLFYATMHEFCDRWLFKHPYEDDLLATLEDMTGIQLDAYLQQWFYHRDHLDYAFAGKEENRDGSTINTTIKLKRNLGMAAPIDIAVIWEQGDTTYFTVAPEGMAYAKPGYILLPPWNQFRSPQDTYEFTIEAERSVSKVVLDPDELLMDLDRRNNRSGLLPPMEWRLDNLLYDRAPLDAQAVRWRPDVWFDDVNGVQLGGHIHSYFLQPAMGLNLDMRIGTRSGKAHLDVINRTPLSAFGANSVFTHRYLLTDHRTLMTMDYSKVFRERYTQPDNEFLRIELEYLDVRGEQENRLDEFRSDVAKYLLDATWDATSSAYTRLSGGSLTTGRLGSFAFVTRDAIGTYKEDERYRAFAETQFWLRLGLGAYGRPYASATLEYWGTNGTPPSQYVQHLSRVRSADRYGQSPVFRTPGTFPVAWENDFYLANSRVRGYQDRIIYLTGFIGGSVELTPPDLLPYRWLAVLPLVGGFLSRMDQTFFCDGGQVTFDDNEQYYPEPIASNETARYKNDEALFVSAGISLKFPPVWRGQSVRLDFPVYLNKPAAGEDDLAFRFSVAWLLPEKM